MRTAVALATPPLPLSADEAVQVPLPFPAVRPVLPAPVERGEDAAAKPLRERSARFLQALVEVLAGDRPARQLAPWMSPEVHDQLRRRLAVHALRGRRTEGRAARIVSVHVSMVTDQVAEIAGRMVHRGRSRAIAIRLELLTDHRGVQRWQCTALCWA